MTTPDREVPLRTPYDWQQAADDSLGRSRRRRRRARRVYWTRRVLGVLALLAVVAAVVALATGWRPL